MARSILQSDGSADPQEALAIAEARSRSTKEHRESVERRANAVHLLQQLFLEEQRALADQFTRPFADKITGYLECLFGAGVKANVRLEDNGFAGLELVRPAHGAGAFAFESLSGGAREQLAAAVRLAMAEVLAEGHDNCLPLIFDDAFAYSDPDRIMALQRMLDLGALRGLQIIILSCNPSDYAALGAKSISLRAEPGSHQVSAGEPSSGISELENPLLDINDELFAAAVRVEVTNKQRQDMISALRSAEGSKGNISLRQTLGWDASTYEAVKNDLISAGQIIPGRGKGGSVALASDVSAGN